MINDVHHHTSIFIPCPTTSIDSMPSHQGPPSSKPLQVAWHLCCPKGAGPAAAAKGGGAFQQRGPEALTAGGGGCDGLWDGVFRLIQSSRPWDG